jgi:adenylate cyclase
MSQIYLHERQHDKAIAAAKKSVALEPNLAFAYTWLGSALMYAGRPHEAIRSYEKAMRRNPFPPGYYIRDLGEAYRMAGRYREAITKFKRAIRGNPDYLEAHLGLACTYASLDRGDDAKTAAAEVLRIDPEFSLQEYEKSLPYKEQRDLNSFIEAMGKAGLPD